MAYGLWNRYTGEKTLVRGASLRNQSRPSTGKQADSARHIQTEPEATGYRRDSTGSLGKNASPYKAVNLARYTLVWPNQSKQTSLYRAVLFRTTSYTTVSQLQANAKSPSALGATSTGMLLRCKDISHSAKSKYIMNRNEYSDPLPTKIKAVTNQPGCRFC